MSQFKYTNDINNLLSIDGPITKGPPARWEKKRERNKSSSSSFTSSKVASFNGSSSKTPLNKSDLLRATKAARGTREVYETQVGDRFIPVRKNEQAAELAEYLINSENDGNGDNSTQQCVQKLCEQLHGIDITKQRILAFQKKAPVAPEGFQNPMKVLYSQNATPSYIKSTRYIPQAPDRILDAPDIVDDYYLNLIDWNTNNVLAAALGSHVFLWNAGTGQIDELLQLEGNDYVCSLAWIQAGDYLAVGTTTGTVELWNCTQSRCCRVMSGHSARVGSLAWNSHVLSSGCRSGQLISHDVRQREHIISTVNAHTQEICGLKWSPDGKLLASGGNDNIINIWSTANGTYHPHSQPLYTFTQHQAAVKALAWCPWQPQILASGGGTADRHIRFWNCNTGSCVTSVDTKSQVCSLLWSTNYKELISGHGFANNQLIIWKYPGMSKVAELTGHTARVLHLAMSPDGSTVLSAGADETLRLWKCFLKEPSKKKEDMSKAKTNLLTKKCIR